MMTVRVMNDEDYDQWDNYVRESKVSSCYHQIGWKVVIEKSFGHATRYLLSEDDEKKINGILPLVHLKSVLFGNFIVSLPYFNYGGVCADSGEIGNQLIGMASRYAEANQAEHIEFRHIVAEADGLPVKTSKVSMRLTLPQNSDELMKSFPAKLRSQVQRPIKERMVVHLGREKELNGFYTIFSINMRDLGTPVYSKEFFRNILRTFPESSWICTVRTEEGQPVASGFLVGFKDMLEMPWASSLRSYNRYSPNMLLYWSVLKLACEKGFTVFDFGRSTPQEGTYRFKEQWGARPLPLYWHYWLKNGQTLPEMNPRNPKYRMAIKIWKKLPVGLSKVIGPVIVKNLP